MDKNLNNIKTRILQYIDYKRITREKFFSNLGLSVQNFKGKALESALSADSMVKILSIHDDINPDWLMYGEGEMIKSVQPFTQYDIPNTQFNTTDQAVDLVEENAPVFNVGKNQFIDLGNGLLQMNIPFVQTFAYAGYLSGFADQTYVDELPRFPIYVNKPHKGTYIAIQVKGDSMDDGSKNAICDNDVVACRLIGKSLLQSKLHINSWSNFLIVHEDGIIIKSIIDHDVEAGVITCHSLNPDKSFFPDFKLHIKDIHQIFNIVQVIRSY